MFLALALLLGTLPQTTSSAASAPADGLPAIPTAAPAAAAVKPAVPTTATVLFTSPHVACSIPLPSNWTEGQHTVTFPYAYPGGSVSVSPLAYFRTHKDVAGNITSYEIRVSFPLPYEAACPALTLQ